MHNLSYITLIYSDQKPWGVHLLDLHTFPRCSEPLHSTFASAHGRLTGDVLINQDMAVIYKALEPAPGTLVIESTNLL